MNFFFKFICFFSIINISIFVKANDKKDNILSSNGLLKNVVKYAPTISEKTLEDTEMEVIETAHKEEEKMSEQINMCLKNYSYDCPLNWYKITENGKELCKANAEYNGFCDTIQSFENFSQNDKMNFEVSCNVEWPCKYKEKKNKCKYGRNYTEPCPNGFILIDNIDNICKADITIYNGVCNANSMNFNYMTNEEKEQWSIACDAYWPCNENCSDKDEFLSVCPKGWKQISSYECIPTKYYKGSCKNKKSFKFYTDLMKKEFEEECKTKFLCTKKCKKTYEENCPLNWKEEKGVCYAPQNFDLCNRKKISIENLTIEEKKKIEEDCSVQWPCKPESIFCEMDWNQDCPEDWSKQIKTKQKFSLFGTKKTDLQNLNDDQYMCLPPSFYKGSCKNIILSNSSSEKDKRKIASYCDLLWPCNKNYKIEPQNTKLNILDYSNVNGPITQSGKIFRSNKYEIIDKSNTNIYDIMK